MVKRRKIEQCYRSIPSFFLLWCPWYVVQKENTRKGREKGRESLKIRVFEKKIFHTRTSSLDLFLINNIRLGKKTICTNLQISNHSIKEFNEKWWRFCRNETNIWRFRANRKLMEGDKEEDSKQGMKKSVLFFFSSFQERY